VLAFPPCTHLASVGSRYWPSKGHELLTEALAIADACMRIAVRSRANAWAIENPSGRLSHAWGPPEFVFNPCDFGGYLDPPGDRYTKRTCLWTGGRFRMPSPKPVEPSQGSLVAVISAPERRSETPRGFALAAFLANRDPQRSSESLRPAESLRPGESILAATRVRCVWCSTEFDRARRDRVYCSTRCRVLACRARHASGA
jgi:hypothetical protein